MDTRPGLLSLHTDLVSGPRVQNCHLGYILSHYYCAVPSLSSYLEKVQSGARQVGSCRRSPRSSSESKDPVWSRKLSGMRKWSGSVRVIRLDSLWVFFFHLTHRVGAVVHLLGRPLLGVADRLPEVEFVGKHVLLVVQVELRVSISDQVKLPRQQEVIEMEVVRTQVQIFFA